MLKCQRITACVILALMIVSIIGACSNGNNFGGDTNKETKNGVKTSTKKEETKEKKETKKESTKETKKDSKKESTKETKKETSETSKSSKTTEKKTAQKNVTNYTSLSCVTTAYCGCSSCSGQWGNMTATGTTCTEGRTVAVDKTVIPLGSKVEIDGHVYTAEDVGGGVKGNHIDIYFSSHSRALNYGKQYKTVKVYK